MSLGSSCAPHASRALLSLRRPAGASSPSAGHGPRTAKPARHDPSLRARNLTARSDDRSGSAEVLRRVTGSDAPRAGPPATAGQLDAGAAEGGMHHRRAPADEHGGMRNTVIEVEEMLRWEMEEMLGTSVSPAGAAARMSRLWFDQDRVLGRRSDDAAVTASLLAALSPACCGRPARAGPGRACGGPARVAACVGRGGCDIATFDLLTPGGD